MSALSDVITHFSQADLLNTSIHGPRDTIRGKVVQSKAERVIWPFLLE